MIIERNWRDRRRMSAYRWSTQRMWTDLNALPAWRDEMDSRENGNGSGDERGLFRFLSGPPGCNVTNVREQALVTYWSVDVSMTNSGPTWSDSQSEPPLYSTVEHAALTIVFSHASWHTCVMWRAWRIRVSLVVWLFSALIVLETTDGFPFMAKKHKNLTAILMAPPCTSMLAKS